MAEDSWQGLHEDKVGPSAMDVNRDPYRVGGRRSGGALSGTATTPVRGSSVVEVAILRVRRSPAPCWVAGPSTAAAHSPLQTDGGAKHLASASQLTESKRDFASRSRPRPGPAGSAGSVPSPASASGSLRAMGSSWQKNGLVHIRVYGASKRPSRGERTLPPGGLGDLRWRAGAVATTQRHERQRHNICRRRPRNTWSAACESDLRRHFGRLREPSSVSGGKLRRGVWVEAPAPEALGHADRRKKGVR